MGRNRRRVKRSCTHEAADGFESGLPGEAIIHSNSSSAWNWHLILCVVCNSLLVLCPLFSISHLMGLDITNARWVTELS